MAAAVDILRAQFEHTARSPGGYVEEGEAMGATGNQVLKGSFAFVGPETFFRPQSSDGRAGSVRLRQGGLHPVVYELPEWTAAEASAFFEGRLGSMPADASGGKALRMKETQGSLWEHVRTGGVVGYAIVAVGALALILIVQKMRDVAQMSVDHPNKVRSFLGTLADRSGDETRTAATTLGATTCEIFTVGLHYRDQPKEVLEEHLQSVLLRQRLHFERRLLLLAVIATAAPLMGLLGTVVGMVKTFSLITVFGTGNAGKLSSGISEVLVATELGLVVAIPALVAHGFLSHRIQKNLSLLERYALEFVTAAQSAGKRVRTAMEEGASV